MPRFKDLADVLDVVAFGDVRAPVTEDGQLVDGDVTEIRCKQCGTRIDPPSVEHIRAHVATHAPPEG